MATILDVGFLGTLTPIFVLVFIFTVTYALFHKTKFFGDNTAFNAVAAIALSLLFIIVPEAQVIITTFTPWITILGILVLFIFMFFLSLGVKGDDMVKVAKDSTFVTFTVIAIIVIFLIALTKAFGPLLVTNQEPGFWNALKRVLFHPRILGVFLVLAIAMYTVRFVTGESSSK